jgi:O-antigen ligase
MLGLGNLDRTDKLVLLIGFLVTVKIRIVGIFSGAELILMPMLFFKHGRCLNSYVKKLMVYAFLWLLGTIASNMHNDIVHDDFIKGVFFLVVLILIIPPIYWLLYDKPERMVLFYLGYGIGSLFSPYTRMDDQYTGALGSQADIYLFYAISFAVSGIGFFLYLKGKRFLGVATCYIVAVIGLFNMARNPFLTGTIATILLFLLNRESQCNITTTVASFQRKIPKYFLFASIAIFVADSVYEPLAASGTLGYEAQEKYFMQTKGGSAIEGGRAETFMGIQLIKENPIWGYGSYARDKNDAFHARYAAEHNKEYIWWATNEDRLLPGHSHIVGAWMQNGILGGIFWIYVLIICWKVFKSGCFIYEPRMLCLTMFLSCRFLWDLIFSPFGDRTYTMFLIITLFIIYDRYRKGDYQRGLVKKLNI